MGFDRTNKKRYLCKEDGLESNLVDKETAIEMNGGALPPDIVDLMFRFNQSFQYIFHFLCAYDMYDLTDDENEEQASGGSVFNP